jgi:hypothetical protein
LFGPPTTCGRCDRALTMGRFRTPHYAEALDADRIAARGVPARRRPVRRVGINSPTCVRTWLRRPRLL